MLEKLPQFKKGIPKTLEGYVRKAFILGSTAFFLSVASSAEAQTVANHFHNHSHGKEKKEIKNTSEKINTISEKGDVYQITDPVVVDSVNVLFKQAKESGEEVTLEPPMPDTTQVPVHASENENQAEPETNHGHLDEKDPEGNDNHPEKIKAIPSGGITVLVSPEDMENPNFSAETYIPINKDIGVNVCLDKLSDTQIAELGLNTKLATGLWELGIGGGLQFESNEGLKLSIDVSVKKGSFSGGIGFNKDLSGKEHEEEHEKHEQESWHAGLTGHIGTDIGKTHLGLEKGHHGVIVTLKKPIVDIKDMGMLNLGFVSPSLDDFKTEDFRILMSLDIGGGSSHH